MDKNFHRSSKAPIFICGEGRSGTKLLRDCLAKHPLLHTFRCESYFFVDSIFQKMRFIDDIKDTDLLIKAVLTALLSKNKPSAEKIIKSRSFDPEYDEYLTDIKTLTDFPYPRSRADEVLRENIAPSELELFHNSDQELCYSGGSSSPLQAEGHYASVIKNILKDTEQCDKFTLLDICANYLTEKSSKQRWIEKTPYHIYYIEKIKKFYPDAKFIINYRDPRAVVASWLKKDSNKTLLGVTNTWNRVANEIHSIKQKNLGNIYFMKYEDLISSPEKILKEICSFLEINYDESLLDVSVVNSFYQDQGKSGFLVGAIDRWKTVLSDKQINLIEILSSRNRQELGYPDSEENLHFFSILSGFFVEAVLLPVKKLTKLVKWVKVN